MSCTRRDGPRVRDILVTNIWTHNIRIQGIIHPLYLVEVDGSYILIPIDTPLPTTALPYFHLAVIKDELSTWPYATNNLYTMLLSFVHDASQELFTLLLGLIGELMRGSVRFVPSTRIVPTVHGT